LRRACRCVLVLCNADFIQSSGLTAWYALHSTQDDALHNTQDDGAVDSTGRHLSPQNLAFGDVPLCAHAQSCLL
jgi:hypothetical protein